MSRSAGVYRREPDLTATLQQYRLRRRTFSAAPPPPPPPPPPPAEGIPFSPPYAPVQTVTGLLIR